MKRFWKTLLVIALFLGIGYTVGDQFYSQRFARNTTFANVDISHLTVEAANGKITQEIMSNTLTLTEDGTPLATIQLADLEPQINIFDQLDSLLQEQNQTSWVTGLVTAIELDGFNAGNLDINPQTVSQAIDDALQLTSQERQVPQNAYIAYSQDTGYYIEPEQTGTQIDEEKLRYLVLEAFQGGETTVEVSDAYRQAEITATNENLQAEWNQIQAYNDLQITLLIAGYEEVITPERILSWLYLDENNQVTFDETMIFDYLGTLNDQYATYDDYRYFNSTLQGQVQLVPGTLGWSIDREAETQAILSDLDAAVPVVREPAIVGVGYNGTLDDIGTSYIEVDILNQTMFVYIDGVQVLATPVVTGQIGTNTIPGAYAIWNLESPSALVGYNPRTERDYVQPVDYWLAFDDTGQGIHDANWQPSFGGDAYLTNGSLGCVNTPPDIMPLVFDYAYPGMPVIVFE
ncbi:L,D-transpeptidase family protein [Fundicoccus culcitae]|uniref:L,D-transpeptidase/peptidoglycan binding protein n=1 Tax=Fundicoccus culcitae TaxID=2969821 RepID=A0ABY5P3L4_9LACT|nr:L,D-transpeptidase family protein [Fundicoccus culcitae]UUX33291.1 L,D-transpeptidase/peptidoglycan binding protein [Fundicoccus culcitae]